LLARAAAGLSRRSAARRHLARSAEHRREPLRRVGCRQRRRHHRRADGLARPAVVGRAAAAAARRALARSRGSLDSARLAIDGHPTAVWPGRPFPLGATWDGNGTNFSVFSEHAERVELCLFDADDREQRIELTQRTAFNWHGYLPGVGPGQRYGL